jgi:NADH-quinone oxidoreductase subunit K
MALEIILLPGLFLFAIGLYMLLARRGPALRLAGIALMLLAGALNATAFGRYVEGGVRGGVFALFALVLALMTAALGLSLLGKREGD